MSREGTGDGNFTLGSSGLHRLNLHRSFNLIHPYRQSLRLELSRLQNQVSRNGNPDRLRINGMNSASDHSHRNLHRSLNSLRRELMQLESNVPSRSLLENRRLHYEDIEGCTARPVKKRNHMEREICHNEPSMDLELSLAPPGMSSRVRGEAHSSSLPLSHQPCMPSAKRPTGSLLTGNINLLGLRPSLVVRGCTHCLIFVMVSELEPKCPRCQLGTSLIDVSRSSTGARKRARRD